MGVTLERVQFKFASIIGELCSEPDILSQFAVWVDLRLAEYKLKGSISLDCSGDTPDPVWLKGILSALLAKRLAKKREQSKPLGHSFGSGSPSSDVNYSRMRSRQSLPSHTESLHADESVVSVKDEPFDDVVYPVGLHAHEISRSPRKRSAAESLRGEDDGEQADIMYAHSMPKQSRSDNQTNESLMSIIGGENRQENNATSHSGFEQITETIDLIVDSEERGNSSLDATDMPSSFPLLDASNDNNFSSLTTEVSSTLRHEDPQTAVSTGPAECMTSAEIFDSGLAVDIKQEPDDGGLYENQSCSTNVGCSSDKMSYEDEAFPSSSNCGQEKIFFPKHPSPSASLLLQRLVNRDPPGLTFQMSRQSPGTMSQTLLNLLEKGKESSASLGSTSGTPRSACAASYTLAALLKGSPSHDTNGPERKPGTPLVGLPVSNPGTAEADSSGSEGKGLTRLRRLLQGEDIASPPCEPFWKKKCEDLESARSALRYFIATQKMSVASEDTMEDDFFLQCIFCGYSGGLEEDNNFILHMFSHANNGDLKKYNTVCPRCDVGGLPSTEFVCHIFSHCILQVDQYPCELCSFSAPHKHDLWRHHSKVHGSPK